MKLIKRKEELIASAAISSYNQFVIDDLIFSVTYDISSKIYTIQIWENDSRGNKFLKAFFMTEYETQRYVEIYPLKPYLVTLTDGKISVERRSDIKQTFMIDDNVFSYYVENSFRVVKIAYANYDGKGVRYTLENDDKLFKETVKTMDDNNYEITLKKNDFGVIKI